MTKAELQSFKAHLPKLRRRIKKTPAYSLMRSAPLPTKLQKGRRIRRPWIWEARKTEEEARTGINPSTKQKIKIPAKTVIKFRVFKVAKDAILGVKE
jgi:DNA-binding protein HU-beta